MTVSKSTVLKVIKEYFILTLGVFLFCGGWGCYMIPNDMSGGGLTGICTVIQFASGGVLPVSVTYGVINVLLLLLAFIIMGGRFGFKTIYCIVLASFVFQFFETFPELHSIEGSFLYLPERFLIPLLAGLTEGLGLGIIFREGGSTGGSDIIALIVNKYWPVSPGRFFLISDIAIVSSMLLLPGRGFSDLIYGFIMVVASSLTIDAVVVGGRSAVQVMIFSQHYEEIADYIIKKMNRGVTAIRTVGWYTQQDRRVLLVILRQKEVFEITKAVKEIDKTAFLSVSPASNVYGEGFEEIKTGIKKTKKQK